MRCAFIGHRDSVDIYSKIYLEIDLLIKSGITEFYSGGMGNFDKMCERVVKELGGKLIYIPYNIKCIKEKDRFWYNDIICPFENKCYSKYDIPERNKWIVDNCDVFLCYVYKNGGAKNTYDYAVTKNKMIINLV